jgi:hypothetical protein
MIHAFGLDTTLDIPRELSAKNQILGADRAGRAQEQDDKPQDIRGYLERSSCQSRPAFAGAGHGGTSGANYCGPQHAPEP